MEAAELRNKTMEELKQELLVLLREKFNLRMQKASGQLNRHTELKKVRRSIARIKTIMTEKAE